MKVKEESEKAGLNLNIQKMKIMASGPLTSWQTDGETMETVIVFIFLGSKITADGDCSHEIKRCLLLGRKARTNPDSILKSRDITLPTKVHLVKAIIFPVVIYGCENWTIKKAERWRIAAFELWCWRRLLRAPWTARSSNQSILKEIIPEYSLEGLMLKVKFRYFGHLMRRTDSLEKSLMLWKIEGRRRRREWDIWMASPTQWTWVCASSGSWWWTGKPGVLFGVTNSQIQLSDWTELNSIHIATVEHTSRNHRKTFKPLCPQQCILSLSQELTSILSLILISLLLFWQFHLKNILFHVFKKLSY